MDIDPAKLRHLRQRRFLTQAELARESGIATSTISQLERGLHRARASTLRKVATALGTTPDALVPAWAEGAAAEAPRTTGGESTGAAS